jgi:hypothetical protein
MSCEGTVLAFPFPHVMDSMAGDGRFGFRRVARRIDA